MIELLPGILWFAPTDDCSADNLRHHGVSVLITDRDELNYTTVLRVPEPRNTERVASDITRLYVRRVCVAISLSAQPNPRPLQEALVREVASVSDPAEVDAIIAANYPSNR